MLLAINILYRLGMKRKLLSGRRDMEKCKVPLRVFISSILTISYLSSSWIEAGMLATACAADPAAAVFDFEASETSCLVGIPRTRRCSYMHM